MSPHARRVARTLRAHALLAPGDRVAIAVSGGADSVALVHLLIEIAGAPASAGALAVAGLIHVHHGLRGDEADRDEAFCRTLADSLGLAIAVGHYDVRSIARATGRSLEAAARTVRDEFFADALPRLGARVVATGHTMDDQAETVLLRLLRGSSRRGVTGIRFVRGSVVRPLLETRRTALRRYLTTRRIAWCEDSSNADERITRNRVRHQILPVLELASPSAVPALARFAALSGDDERFLTGEAIKATRTLVSWTEGRAECGPERLAALAPAIGRRVVREALERVGFDVPLRLAHVDAVLRAARSGVAEGHLDLPSLDVNWRAGRLTIARRAADRPGDGPEETRPAVLARETELPVAGSVRLEGAGLLMSAELVSAESVPVGADGRGRRAALQRDAVVLPMRIRSRRPGDRIRPLGAPGRRKVQDVLVDGKVPVGDRDLVPIVTDATGRILWVAGHALAHECRVTAPAAGMVLLKVDTL